MIYGLGHDIIEIERVNKLLRDPIGARFVARILTEREQAVYAVKGGRQAEFVAGRFAAKEAIVKAFGTGIGEMISFQDIEILPDRQGKPIVCLRQAAWQRLDLSSSEYRIHLSISHQPSVASVQAIVEWRTSEWRRKDYQE